MFERKQDGVSILRVAESLQRGEQYEYPLFANRLNPHHATSCTITDEGIIYSDASGTHIISYKQIKRVRVVSNFSFDFKRYQTFHFDLVNGRSIRLISAIKNNNDKDAYLKFLSKITYHAENAPRDIIILRGQNFFRWMSSVVMHALMLIGIAYLLINYPRWVYLQLFVAIIFAFFWCISFVFVVRNFPKPVGIYQPTSPWKFLESNAEYLRPKGIVIPLKLFLFCYFNPGGFANHIKNTADKERVFVDFLFLSAGSFSALVGFVCFFYGIKFEPDFFRYFLQGTVLITPLIFLLPIWLMFRYVLGYKNMSYYNYLLYSSFSFLSALILSALVQSILTIILLYGVGDLAAWLSRPPNSDPECAKDLTFTCIFRAERNYPGILEKRPVVITLIIINYIFIFIGTISNAIVYKRLLWVRYYHFLLAPIIILATLHMLVFGVYLSLLLIGALNG